MNNLGNPDTRLLLKALGQDIARERKARGWTKQADLAYATQYVLGDLGQKAVSEKQVGEIERGDRGQMREVWLCALALGVPLSKLVKLAEDRILGEREPGTPRASARDAS